MMVVVPTGVGAGFRIKRRLHVLGQSAELVDHVRHHVVRADTKGIADELHREMAVAKMPDDPHEQCRIRGGDLRQRFRTSADTNDATVL